MKSIIKKNIKNVFKLMGRIINPPLRDFKSQDLPWIDRPNPDIDAFIREYPKNELINYDLKEKLIFWKENGYVIFEQANSEDLIDRFLNNFRNFIENRDKFQAKVFIELPSFKGKRIQHVRNVSKEILKGKYIKFLDFHNLSKSAKELMLHRSILYFLEAVFKDTIVGMQSLTFNYGSQQSAHQDFVFVKPGIPSHLAASWIPLEDVHEDAGPLFYYKGSHKIKKFDFGNGILYFENKSIRSPDEYSKYIVAECKRHNLERKKLLIKKGDILIWHSALVHGGDRINNENLTRKSYVCHYSTKSTYKAHLIIRNEEPKVEVVNGGLVYKHPIFVEEENYYK